MSHVNRIVRVWLPLAFLSVAFGLLVYVAVQQTMRRDANDPQVQLARDAADRLSTGAPAASVLPPESADVSRSLAPFMVIYDGLNHVLASSARLHGQDPIVPSGVLDVARQTGGNGVSWQPEPGVRVATVEVAVPGSAGLVVLAGRSLREVDENIRWLGILVGTAVFAILVVSLLGVAVLELASAPVAPASAQPATSGQSRRAVRS